MAASSEHATAEAVVEPPPPSKVSTTLESLKKQKKKKKKVLKRRRISSWDSVNGASFFHFFIFSIYLSRNDLDYWTTTAVYFIFAYT